MARNKTRLTLSVFAAVAVLALSLALAANAVAATPGDDEVPPVPGETPESATSLNGYFGSSLTTDLVGGGILPTGRYYFRVQLAVGETLVADFTTPSSINLKAMVLPYATGYSTVESKPLSSTSARLTFLAPVSGMFTVYVAASDYGTFRVEPSKVAAVPGPPVTPVTLTQNVPSRLRVVTGQQSILSGSCSPDSLIGKVMHVDVKKPGRSYWTYSSNRVVYAGIGGHAAWQYKYTFKRGMTKGVYTYRAVYGKALSINRSVTLR